MFWNLRPALLVPLVSLAVGCAEANQGAATGTTSPTNSVAANTAATNSPSPAQVNAMSIHEFTMNTIDGTPKSLAEYKGKVLLVVNTASECGYTPQYAGLVTLHEKLQSKGFSVLGFPANDFGAQEPGSDSEIKQFCDAKFHVSFPMFSKIVVKGSGKNPLYAFLTQTPPAGEVKWNFEKFLVGKDGKVVGRYPSSVTPEDPKLGADIEAALAK